MFISYESYFLKRNTSIKGQKLVGEVVKRLGVDEKGENSSGGGQGSDGSGSKDKQNGLVRVRIRDLHDDWPEDALPVMQMKGGFGSGSKDGTTDEFKQIPPVGSKIFCEFEANSQYHGVYHGGSATEDKKVGEFTGDENYGKTYGHADTAGNLFKIRTEEGKEEIMRQHVSGTMTQFDKDGGYNINAMKNVSVGGEAGNFKFDKNGTLEFGGDLVIRAGGKVRFEGKTMEFAHGGATTNQPIQMGGSGPTSPGSRTKPTKRNRPSYNKPGTKV